jgi:hypothetical protein
MNLLCPNCQKMLTVPEQYAGQLMKCPLCSGTFTVPALPGAPSVEPAPAFSSPPPAPPPPPVVNTPGSPPPGATAPSSPYNPTMADAYGLKSEPEPAFHAPPPVETPAFSPAPPEPAFSLGAPAPASPPPAPVSPVTGPPAAPSAPALQPPPPSAPAAGFTRSLSIRFSDKVLQWVPPVTVVLIFVCQIFFAWVGVYPGGVPAVTQNAWQAGFGSVTTDADMSSQFKVIGEEDAKKDSETRSEKAKSKEVAAKPPGMSVPTFFYLLFFVVTFFVTLAVAVLPFVKVPLPPWAQQLLPWRWIIVAGLNAVLLLFLGLQLVFGFDLESKADSWIQAWVQTQPEGQKSPDSLKTHEKKQLAFLIGEREAWIQRTNSLRLVVLLHLLALASAAMVYGIEKRGPSKPLPRLELMW